MDKNSLSSIRKLLEEYLYEHFNNLKEKLIHNHLPLLYVQNKPLCPYCKSYGNIFESKKSFLTINDV